MSISAVNGSSTQWELVKAQRTNKTSHTQHQLVHQKSNGDQAQFAFKVVNQQLDRLFLEQKNDLRKEIVSAIGPKGLRQKFAVNRAVNGILNHPGFQAYFKLMMMQTLKRQSMEQHQRSRLKNRGELNLKSDEPRFASWSDWIPGRKHMIANSTNEALDLATSDPRRRQQTNYLSDVMYGAYQQTKSRIAEDVLQYCGDNAMPLGLIASGVMLPGTLGQVVSAGGLQLLLPDPESTHPVSNIGMGAALTAVGGYLESGWLSGVLSGTGLLRASFGALNEVNDRGFITNDWSRGAALLSVVAGQPALGWFLPQGPASQALLISGLSIWPAILGEELEKHFTKQKKS